MKQFIGSLLKKRTFPILLIRVLNTLLVMLILIFLSRNLEIESYGNYIQFWVTITLAIAFGSIGMASVLYNFSIRGWIEFYQKLNKKTLTLYLAYTIFIAGLGVLYLYFFLDEINTSTLFYIFIIILASILSFILDNIIIILEKAFVQLFITLPYIFLLFYFHYDFSIHHHEWNILFSQYAILITLKTLFQFFLFRKISFQISAKKEFQHLPILSPDKKNWIQLSINEILQFFMRYVDKFVVNIIATKEFAAIYFNGRQDIPFLSAIYSSFGHGLLIELSKRINIDDASVIEAIKNTLKKLAAIVICIVCFCWVYSEEIFKVVFTEKYIESVPVFRIGLLLLPAQFLLSLTYILQYKRHSNLINKGTYYELILIILIVFPMYHFLGPIGIISTFVISTFFQNFYYLLKIAQLYKRPFIELLPSFYYILYTIFCIGIAWSSHSYFSKNFTAIQTLIFGIFLGSSIASLSFLFQLKNQQQNNKG